MKALTNVQRKILTAASKQPKLPIEEHMGRIKGGTAVHRQIAYSLLCSGYVSEDGDQHYITDEGIAALTAKHSKAKAAKPAKQAKQKKGSTGKAKKSADAKTKKAKKPAKSAKPVEASADSKPAKGRQLLIDMMSREEGATGQQMVDATGWQKGAVFGTLSKIRKLLATRNQVIASDKDDSGKLVYKIA